MRRSSFILGLARSILLAFVLGVVLAAFANAQSIALNDASTYTQTHIDMNQAGSDYFGPFQLKNLPGTNPGFEPQQWSQVISVNGTGSTTSFTSVNNFDTVSANFWAGGTFWVAAGSNAGCSGAISANTAASGGNGPTFTIAACSNAFALNDVVYVYQHQSCAPSVDFSDFGWNTDNTGSGTTAADCVSGDQYPSSFGIENLKITLTNSSDRGGINAIMDNVSGLIQYYFNGTYTWQFKTNTSTSGCTAYGNMTRSGGFNVSSTTSLSTGWQTDTITFTGLTEGSGTTAGTVNLNLQIGCPGAATVWLDDSDLTSAADTNPTQFTNDVIHDETTILDVDGTRDWNGVNQDGQSLDNFIVPQLGRMPSTNTTAYYANNTIDLGLGDFLAKAAYEGQKQVMFTVPITFNDTTDAQNLSDYLCGGSGTTYGAKRIAYGQTTPWCSVFSRIAIEYGNEVWNSGAGGQYIPFSSPGPDSWPYLNIAVSFCQEMKGRASWNGSVMKCAAGLQAGAFGTAQQAILATLDPNHYVDLQTTNEYMQGSCTNNTGNNAWISAYTEPWAHAFDATDPYYATYNSSPLNAQYEYQNNTTSGSCVQTGYPEGEGYAIADVLAPLLQQKVFGIQDSYFFDLSQYDFGSPKLWGAFTGNGGQLDNPRPSAYAIGLVNKCIGSGNTAFAITPSSIPTYNFSGFNGVNAESDVPFLQFFAFKNGSTRCIVALNVDTSSSHSFTVSGTNPPAGSVVETSLTSANLTDNNESSITVSPSASTVSNPTSFTIPPHSMMSISYSIGGVSAPVGFSGHVTISGKVTIQ